MHQYACEVIEFIYCQSDDKERQEIVIGLHGNYFLLLKDFLVQQARLKQEPTLHKFLEQKPTLREGILNKLENTVQKLVEKGLSRHSIVQAVVYDYIQNQTDLEKLKQLADSVKEKLPALLASRQGLASACALFTLLDAKDRKTAIKQLPVQEMLQNKIAHLFLIHVANTLDDTQLTKKKLLHESLKSVDDLIGDKGYQAFTVACLLPPSLKNPLLSKTDVDSLNFLSEHSTSKKDADIRANELFKIAQKPLEKFFEEKLTYYLQNIREQPILRALCLGICHCKFLFG